MRRDQFARFSGNPGSFREQGTVRLGDHTETGLEQSQRLVGAVDRRVRKGEALVRRQPRQLAGTRPLEAEL